MAPAVSPMARHAPAGASDATALPHLPERRLDARQLRRLRARGRSRGVLDSARRPRWTVAALHLVSIAESAVDWERTDRYAQATRARHYAATRGEADFDQLSDEVARALNDVALTKDPAKRLALATEARRMLGDVARGAPRLSSPGRRAAGGAARRCGRGAASGGGPVAIRPDASSRSPTARLLDEPELAGPVTARERRAGVSRRRR